MRVARTAQTVLRVENKDGIYWASFPEYPDCEAFCCDNLKDILDIAECYLASYILTNFDGEFPPHKCSINDFMEYSSDGRVFTNHMAFDIGPCEEILKDFSAAPEAFYDCIQRETDKILKSAKKPEKKPVSPQPGANKEETDDKIDVEAAGKEAKRRSNDPTSMFDEGIDSEIEDNVFNKQSSGKKKNKDNKK